MKVLIIVGSGSKNSHSLGLGKAIKKSFEAKSVDAELIDLVEYGLPIYDNAVEKAKTWDKPTKDFLDKSQDADAYVWITPIYHNSFSGILKNALDWQHFKMPDKIVGLASNGGRSTQAVDKLMMTARAQHMIPTRTRVCTDGSDYDDERNIVAEDINKRIEDFTDEIISLSQRMSR